MNSLDAIGSMTYRHSQKGGSAEKIEDYSAVDEESRCARFEAHRLRDQSTYNDVPPVIVQVGDARDLIESRRRAQNCLSVLL